MTLEQIIDGCRNGEAEARRELYEHFSGTMYGVVRRYVRDEPTAEDLFHDGFVTVFTRIGEYRNEGSFEGWCRRIFVNTVLSSFRKKNPLSQADEVDTLGASRSVEPTAMDELSAGEILLCVEELPEGYRTVFNLHAIEGFSYPEISEMLDISESTTRSQYRRARMKLIELIRLRYGIHREVVDADAAGKKELKERERTEIPL